jgi:tetratricopeptide (TPR) repeat protein
MPRTPESAVRAALLFALLALLALLASACLPPTLSAPRGDAHLAALREGERHHHHGRMLEAARAYGEAARLAERRVDRDEALYRQAKSLVRADRPREALPILDRVASTRPPSRRTARALFDAAKLRLALGDRDAAVRGLERVVRAHANEGPGPRALRLLVRIAREEGGIPGALALLARLDADLRETDLGDDLLTYEAELARETGDRARARRALERLVEEHPYPEGERWDDALVRLADMDEEDGDAAAAIAHLERLLTVHETTMTPGSYTLPTQPAAALRIARLERDARRDHEAAARAFRRVWDQFSSSTLRDDALLELGEMIEANGERDEACGLYRKIVEEVEAGRARRRAARHLEACGR